MPLMMVRGIFSGAKKILYNIGGAAMELFRAHGIAIDLGTANTIVYASRKGIISEQPSFVALVKCQGSGSKIPCAFGHEAKRMLGKTSMEISVIRPLKDGVIADFKGAEEMIKHFIKISTKRKFLFARPLIVVCVPYGSTPVERRAIQEAVESAGARDVFLIEEPMAAAIGAGLPVTEPTGCMVVDIGGGTTEVGVMSLNNIVTAKSIRVGGDAMDEAIINYVRQNYNLLIGESTAERIKKEVGAAQVIDNKSLRSVAVKGRDMLTGVPKEIILYEDKITESLSDTVTHIIKAVKDVLECTPPELSGDIVERGIALTGGVALLPGLDKVISCATGLHVYVPNDPLRCVVIGIGRVVEEFLLLKHVLFKQD